jgi:hypothetical protein
MVDRECFRPADLKCTIEPHPQISESIRRFGIQTVNALNIDLGVDLHEPPICESSDASSSDDYIDMRDYVGFGGEFEGFTVYDC